MPSQGGRSQFICSAQYTATRCDAGLVTDERATSQQCYIEDNIDITSFYLEGSKNQNSFIDVHFLSRISRKHFVGIVYCAHFFLDFLFLSLGYSNFWKKLRFSVGRFLEVNRGPVPSKISWPSLAVKTFQEESLIWVSSRFPRFNIYNLHLCNGSEGQDFEVFAPSIRPWDFWANCELFKATRMRWDRIEKFRLQGTCNASFSSRSAQALSSWSWVIFFFSVDWKRYHELVLRSIRKRNCERFVERCEGIFTLSRSLSRVRAGHHLACTIVHH